MTVGQRIRLSRQACGLSLRHLEASTRKRVTAQAIRKYERDESRPDSRELIALANALDVPIEYLASESNFRMEAIDFRKKRFTSRREEAQVEASVLNLLERYFAVEESLGLSTVEWDMPREAPWPVLRDPAEAEQAALGLRTHWGLGADPIANLFDVLEQRGVTVLTMDLPDIDGLTARVHRENRSTASVVIANQGDWGERQRFTLSRELGHTALDTAAKVDAEKAAHRFAGAFLMPAETLKAEIGGHCSSIEWSKLFGLKRFFGVSVQALTYRCRDLGIFDAPLARKLFNQFTSRGWRRPPYKELSAMPSERSTRFERLCFRALSEGAISEAKAAELLRLSVQDLNRLIDKQSSNGAAHA